MRALRFVGLIAGIWFAHTAVHAQTWAYDVTYVKVGEATSAAEIKAEIEGLPVNMSPEQVEAAAKARSSDQTSNMSVAYRREGDTWSGPFFSTAGETGRAYANWFEVGQDYSLYYTAYSSGASFATAVEILPKDNIYYRVLPWDVVLLMGPGNLKSRYEDLAANGLPKKYKPHWMFKLVVEPKKMVLRYGTKATAAIYTLEEGGTVLVKERYHPDGHLMETIRFKELDDSLAAEPRKIPIGTRVGDFRFGEHRGLFYEWEGDVPPLSTLQEPPLPKGSRAVSPIYYLVGAGTLFLAGAGILALKRRLDKVNGRS